MNMSVRYCTHCGKPLSAEARFCGRCGRPVKPIVTEERLVQAASVQPVVNDPTPGWAPASLPPSPPPAAVFPPIAPQVAPVPMAEPIVGVIPGAMRKKGFLGMSADNFTLVITDRRIIFATQTAQMMKENALRARETAKAQGKNFLSQWGSIIRSNYGQHYLQMTADAVLSENPGNFSLYHNQVRSVKIHYYSDDESSTSEHHMAIETVTGKINLAFSMLDEKQAKKVLKQVLGNAIH